MGIWNFLTKPIKLTSDKFYWQEPLGMRLSLRGDLLIRLGVALTVWAAVSGLFWILFAFNVNPPELGVAMFVAIFIGLGPACLALFMRREQVSASIWIYDDHLIRQRSYVSLALISSWKEISEWPNAAITRVIFIPAEDLGKSFSVMLLSIDKEVELVGAPAAGVLVAAVVAPAGGLGDDGPVEVIGVSFPACPGGLGSESTSVEEVLLQPIGKAHAVFSIALE